MWVLDFCFYLDIISKYPELYNSIDIECADKLFFRVTALNYAFFVFRILRVMSHARYLIVA